MKVNRILILFLLFIMLSSVGLWNLIQSDFIGKKVSRILTEKISQQLKADVNFKSLEIKLYPPGLELNDFKFKREGESPIELFALKAGVRFDLIKSMQRELTLDDIYLEDIKLEMSKQKKKNQSEFKIEDFSIRKIIKELNEKVPIKFNRIAINKLKLKYEKYSVDAKKVVVSPLEDGVILYLDIENLRPTIYDFDISTFKTKITVKDDAIDIDTLEVSTKKESIRINGTIVDYKKKENAKVILDYELNGKVKYFNKYLKKMDLDLIEDGSFNLLGQVEGNINKFAATSSIKLKNLKTPFVDADEVKSEISMNNSEIRVRNLKLKKDLESISLKKPFQFLNLEKMTFVDEPIEVTVSKLKLKNALKVLKEHLSILDGKITGDIKFILNKDDYHFYVEDKVLVKDLSLNIDNTEIMNVPELFSSKAKFSVFREKFEMEMDIHNSYTKLSVVGKVDFEKGLKFSSRNAKVDLKEVGRITGLNYEGQGNADIEVFMDKEKNKAYMKVEGDFKNFKLEEYSQKKLQAKINLDFNKSKLNISDIKASAGRTKSKGYLDIDLNDMSVSGKAKHENIIYEEFLNCLDLEDYLDGRSVEGNWSAEYSITGKLDPDLIILKGKIKGKNNLVLDESIDSIVANLEIKNKKIAISDIFAKKSKGSIRGDFSYSIKDEKSVFSILPLSIALEELTFVGKLPLGINGKMSGEISGIYTKELSSFSTKLDVVETVIPGKDVGNSHLEFDLNEKVVDIKLSLLGDKINLESTNYLDDVKDSKLNFYTAIDDINEIIGTNRLVDLENTNIKGQFYSKGQASYKIKELKLNSAKLNVEKFNLNKDIVNFNYNNPNLNEVEVVNGLIKKWSFYMRGQNFYFISKASGALDKTFDLETDFKIDASIFEIFNKVISKASGPIYGKYKLSDLKDLSNQKLKLRASGLSLSTSGYPVRFENIGFEIDADNENITIQNFSSKIGAGVFNLVGGLNIEHIVPKVNFDYKFTHAGINLFEKSNVIFSGQGKLQGDSFPYKLKSSFYIERFNLINEFADLVSGSSILKDDIKYLPDSYVDNSQNLLDLDIGVKLINPASVKNSMSDLSYLGRIDISGSEISPVAKGSLYLAPGINKIFFKGNEYDILKSNITFLETDLISNPELDIEASSNIEDYSLSAKVTGPVDSFELTLRTDPSLEENDILSLIAFGYTENTSSSLTEEQKNLMTQAGIGSLLFESFKINETLKKELGIQLNLGTEISSINENYLSQKSATATSSQSVTSATKIELKKEITSNVDLSVSSTIGSSTQQRQRMNLNYKVSDKVSLEGVYENSTNTETRTQGDDSSLGIDVRWKWTFK